MVLLSCGSEPDRRFAPFPAQDFALAFLIQLRDDGSVAQRSEVFGLSGGAPSFGQPSQELTLESGDRLLLFGFEAQTLLAAEPSIDLTRLETSELTVARETCLNGRLDGERAELQLPTTPYAEAFELGEGSSAFTAVSAAAHAAILDEYALTLPVRPTGCELASGQTTMRSFLGSNIEIGSGIWFGERLDIDRALFATDGVVSLVDRTTSTPEIPVADFSMSTAAPGYELTGVDVLAEADGNGHRAVLIGQASSATAAPSIVLELEVGPSSLSLIQTSTAVPEILSAVMYDRQARVLAGTPDGGIWKAPSVGGPWSRWALSEPALIDHAEPTDDPSRPHLFSSKDSGSVFLGDFYREQRTETSRPSTTMIDIASNFDEAGLYLWGASNPSATFEPRQIFHRPPGEDWKSKEILAPPAGGECGEVVECGRIRLFSTFNDLDVGGSRGEPFHRMFAAPRECSAVLAFRSTDVCPTLLPLETRPVERNGLVWRVDVFEDRILTAFGKNGQIYEVDL